MHAVTMIALLTLSAAPEPAGDSPGAGRATAAVTVQVISAKAGSGRTGEGIDARLAEKLRVSLEQMGMRKPDLESLVRPATRTVGPGEAVTVTTGGGGVEAGVKSVEGDEVVLSVALFTEPKSPREPRRYSPATSVRFKPGSVMPFVQPLPGGEGVRIFVVGAAPAEK